MNLAVLAIVALGGFSAGSALGVVVAGPWLRRLFATTELRKLKVTYPQDEKPPARLIVEALDRIAAGQVADARRADLLLEQLGLLTAALVDLTRATEGLSEETRELRDELARQGRR